MGRVELLAAALLAAASASSRAEDWLDYAVRAADAASIASEPPSSRPRAAWTPVEFSEFQSVLPSTGWYAYEEDDALGTVVRAFGPDSSSGSLRAMLSVRLIDHSTPGYRDAKTAVDEMRRDAPGRDPTPVRAIRVAAGLARVFEVTLTRREAADDGPAIPESLHEYVAVIPRGESYYLLRFVSTRRSYLDSRDVFVRFLKELSPLGSR